MQHWLLKLSWSKTRKLIFIFEGSRSEKSGFFYFRTFHKNKIATKTLKHQNPPNLLLNIFNYWCNLVLWSFGGKEKGVTTISYNDSVSPLFAVHV